MDSNKASLSEIFASMEEQELNKDPDYLKLKQNIQELENYFYPKNSIVSKKEEDLNGSYLFPEKEKYRTPFIPWM